VRLAAVSPRRGLLNDPFTIKIHDTPAIFCKRVKIAMAQRRFKEAISSTENVLSFRRPSTPDQGAAAIDLVYQAADVFRGIEEQARETEARAKSLCNSAIDKVRRAETRAESAEQAHRTILVNAEEKLRDASRALEQAKSRLEAKEDQLTAMEFRAQAAEAEARQAKQALALVEEAIRRQLLRPNLSTLVA
jgi:septal ring factor EnvC (AmiA/AmiB activator)